MGYFIRGTYARFSILGNIGKKELLFLPYQGETLPVLKLSIAVNYKNGEEETAWVPVSIAGKRAESLSKVLEIGQKVLVDGIIRTKNWADKDGNPRRTFSFQAKTVILVGGKKGNNTEEEPQEEEEIPVDAEESEEEEVPF